MNVTRYRAGDRRYLVVDAEHYVPDRAAFAARYCDPDEGVSPAEVGAVDGTADVDQGVSGPRGGPGVAADGGSGGEDAGRPAGPDASPASGTSSARGADSVLFLALERDFTPPRVVMTVVHPDGERSPCCTRGARCAALWVAERTNTARAMIDTQAGTREARIHDDGSVSVEVVDAGDGRCGGVDTERGPAVREFATEVPRLTP